MNRLHRTLAISVFFAVLLVFSIQLDPLAATGMARYASFTSAARFFSFIGNGAFLIPLCLFLYILGMGLKGTDLRKAGRDALYSFALSGIAVHILKAAFERPRMAHASGAVMKLLSNPSFFDYTGRFNSFPSGHTVAGFSVAYALSKRYPALRVLFYAVAVLIGASRVYTGSHYPSDVVVGAVVGIWAGYLITCRGEVKKKWLFSGLTILIISMSFFKTGGYLLFDVDEAVFSEASREMVETGDYITPTYNYEPRYDKPILFYWFMAAAFKLFGATEFAARFPSGGFGVLLVFMTFFFIKRVRGELAAYACALVLLLNVGFFFYSHSAITDMTLAFFITASVFSFYLALHENDHRWFAAFWAASALAALTKGAVGLVVPLATTLLFLAASRRLSEVKELFRPPYLAIFFIIAGPWFAIEAYLNGWDFFNSFVIKHHIQRYSAVISGHSGPPYFYIGVLILGFFPWAALLPGALYRGFMEAREKLLSLPLLASVWFAFVFIFFSISKTKLPNYIFPLFPASAILAGLAFAEIIENRPGAGRRWLYALSALSAAMAAFMFIFPSMDVKMPFAFPIVLYYGLGAVAALIATLGITARRYALASFLSISFLSAAFIIMMRLWALPSANIALQKTLYDYSLYSRSIGPGTVLAAYELNKPSIAFYAGRKVESIGKLNACNIKEHAKRSDLLVITSPSFYDTVEELKPLAVIDQSGDYILLGTDGMPPFKK